jgi:gamma-tubulin complex component 5
MSHRRHLFIFPRLTRSVCCLSPSSQILLSRPPIPSTHTCASLYLSNLSNPHTIPTLTWKDILAEEPFEGQHWEGAYGLPLGSTVEDWEVRSGGSTPSLSPVDDDDDNDDTDSDDLLSSEPLDLSKGEASPACPMKTVGSRNRTNDYRYQHRADVEILQSRQYWRPEWHTDAVVTRAFDLGDASTLGTVPPELF